MVDPQQNNIQVDVETRYIEDQSNPDQNNYVFAYTITIQNRGEQAAQLLTRHWVITDGTGEVEEVRGEGVVGQQPHLLPLQGFEYTSGAILKTPVGAMQGEYEFSDASGEKFEVPIAPFTLSMPNLVH